MINFVPVHISQILLIVAVSPHADPFLSGGGGRRL